MANLDTTKRTGCSPGEVREIVVQQTANRTLHLLREAINATGLIADEASPLLQLPTLDQNYLDLGDKQELMDSVEDLLNDPDIAKKLHQMNKQIGKIGEGELSEQAGNLQVFWDLVFGNRFEKILANVRFAGMSDFVKKMAQSRSFLAVFLVSGFYAKNALAVWQIYSNKKTDLIRLVNELGKTALPIKEFAAGFAKDEDLRLDSLIKLEEILSLLDEFDKNILVFRVQSTSRGRAAMQQIRAEAVVELTESLRRINESSIATAEADAKAELIQRRVASSTGFILELINEIQALLKLYVSLMDGLMRVWYTYQQFLTFGRTKVIEAYTNGVRSTTRELVSQFDSLMSGENQVLTGSDRKFLDVVVVESQEKSPA